MTCSFYWEHSWHRSAGWLCEAHVCCTDIPHSGASMLPFTTNVHVCDFWDLGTGGLDHDAETRAQTENDCLGLW